MPLGAHTSPRMNARRETRNLEPFEKNWTWQGVTAEVSGPTKLPLSNFTRPLTWTVTGAAARTSAFRPTFKLQNV